MAVLGRLVDVSRCDTYRSTVTRITRDLLPWCWVPLSRLVPLAVLARLTWYVTTVGKRAT